jgi:hypothetical protein
MLNNVSPRRRVSQAPLKQTTCLAGCGTAVTYRTNPRVCCEPCRIARKAESARQAAATQRRKHGIPQVKGSKISCAGCGVEVTLNRNAGARYCRSCYLKANGLDARLRSKAKASTREGRDATNAWQREKRRKDPSARVSAHMRVMIHRGIGKAKAGRSWRNFVPYTLEELMAHLERQFLPGMTWLNKGAWHIDHVRPISRFKFEKPDDPEFQEAWALSNLRPLWGVDNIRKQARRTHLL